MGSLSGSLSIGMSGLQAAQDELNVCTNNISNINTAGYTRQVVNLNEQTPLQEGQMSFGTGVSVGQITSVRDNVLELQIANETQQQAQSQGYLNPMQQVQNLFNDSSGTGLQSALSNFFNSFTQLSTDPSNSALRQSVLGAAQLERAEPRPLKEAARIDVAGMGR